MSNMYFKVTIEKNRRSQNFDIPNSKRPCILLNKNISFNKNETESKMENPTQSSERRTLCFSSCKDHKLKVKF